ncbi:hypothetical protein MUK42_35199 [Musa troglodytarum]|uniref:Solute carrier family 35 member F1 n=1 Tax=Musa troglodytarum TaxID=320322 RepID=A0A9E7L8L1_9LILI|nr:hypothetical protein MUK42_35199 [Musa troglodytarum]
MMECNFCHSKFPLPASKTVSRAYDNHKSKISSKQRALHVMLVVGDCILVGLQPILVYMSKVDGSFKFSPISVNFLTEATKALFAIMMLLFQSRRQKVGDRPLLSVSNFVQAARNNILLAVPAFLYAINNYLKFIMQLYFNPATVKMLSNLKLEHVLKVPHCFGNCCSFKDHNEKTLFHYPGKSELNGYTLYSWEALALLLIGISVNQLRSLPEGTMALGLPVATGAYLYTLIFVSVPSLASVYNEYALKSQFETSIYLQNLFLYGYGAIFNFMAIIGIAVIKGTSSFHILEGHSKATMFLICNNAAQGILSSFFFKYADTILKKYSSTVATIFTGIASAALFGHTLTMNFVLGISIVFISMHQFFSPLAKVKDETPNGDLEMRDAQEYRSKETSFIDMAAGATEDVHNGTLAQNSGWNWVEDLYTLFATHEIHHEAAAGRTGTTSMHIMTNELARVWYRSDFCRGRARAIDRDKGSVLLSGGMPIVDSESLHRSIREKWKKVWTKRSLIGLVLGQFVSLLITSTGFSSSELARRGVNAPTSQSFLNYLLLAIFYGAYVIYRKRPLQINWYYYLILSIVDVEANFIVVKSYQYTSLTSVMLLDCWAIPCVILLTWLFLKTKYGYRKFTGVAICVAGIVMVVFSDVHASDRSEGGPNPVKGDILVIAGATLYAVSNVGEEFIVKEGDRIELMAMLGIFGAVVSAIQISILERNELKDINWTAGAVLPFLGFALALFLFYSTVPIILKICGATLLNLSLLTSDMWAVFIRIFAYHQKVDWMYFIAFAAVAVGIVTYSGGKNKDAENAQVAEASDERDKIKDEEAGADYMTQGFTAAVEGQSSENAKQQPSITISPN